jgi:hypothetical protein
MCATGDVHGIAAITAGVAEIRRGAASCTCPAFPYEGPLMNERHHRLRMQGPRRKSRIRDVGRTYLYAGVRVHYHTDGHPRGKLRIEIGEVIVGGAIEDIHIVAAVNGEREDCIFDSSATHRLNDNRISPPGAIGSARIVRVELPDPVSTVGEKV